MLSFLLYSTFTGFPVIWESTAATGSTVTSSLPPKAPPMAGATIRILL